MYIVSGILSFFKALDNPASRVLAGLASVAVVMGFIIYLLPTYALPEEISDAFTWLFQTLWRLNFILPVDIIVWAIWVILILDFSIMGIKFAMFGYKAIFKNN